jgi:hypothetical protein
MTELKQSTVFEQLKGKIVVLRGQIREIGVTTYSGGVVIIFEAEVSDLSSYDDIPKEVMRMVRLMVRLDVKESQVERIKYWNKGERHTLWGRISDQGFLDEDIDVGCDLVKIVD